MAVHICSTHHVACGEISGLHRCTDCPFAWKTIKTDNKFIAAQCDQAGEVCELVAPKLADRLNNAQMQVIRAAQAWGNTDADDEIAGLVSELALSKALYDLDLAMLAN